jgi:hypothetical protein
MLWNGLPLINGEATRQYGNGLGAYQEGGEQSIYFGIGLTGANELSPGLPIDVLSLILTAEYARRHLGWSGKAYVLLADTHAIEVGRQEREVRRMASELEENLSNVFHNLGLHSFVVITASSLLGEARYQELLDIHANEPTYARYQWADCAFLSMERGVRLKVSWALEGRFKPGVRDERTFDKGFQERWEHLPLSFLYTQAGRTYDQESPRSAPYLTRKGQARLLLAKESNAVDFLKGLDQALVTKMKNTSTYLKELTKLFEHVIAPISSQDLGERLQAMLDMSYGRI